MDSRVLQLCGQPTDIRVGNPKKGLAPSIFSAPDVEWSLKEKHFGGLRSALAMVIILGCVENHESLPYYSVRWQGGTMNVKPGWGFS